jgi:hypothetical protein
MMVLMLSLDLKFCEIAVGPADCSFWAGVGWGWGLARGEGGSEIRRLIWPVLGRIVIMFFFT